MVNDAREFPRRSPRLLRQIRESARDVPHRHFRTPRFTWRFHVQLDVFDVERWNSSLAGTERCMEHQHGQHLSSCYSPLDTCLWRQRSRCIRLLRRQQVARHEAASRKHWEYVLGRAFGGFPHHVSA